jgi:hypothetical protein
MLTKHFAYSDRTAREIISSFLQKHCDDIVKKHGIHLRLVKQGAGFAILPDTNCKEDILESEFAKAFHLGEIPTATTPKPERINMILTYEDFDDMFLSLTADQLKLLEWLRRNDYLCEGVEYIAIGSEKFTEI